MSARPLPEMLRSYEQIPVVLSVHNLRRTLLDAADELERTQKRLEAQVARAQEWEARGRAAEQALGLYGAAS